MNKMKEGVADKGESINNLFNKGLAAGSSLIKDGVKKPNILERIKAFIPYTLSSALIFGKLREVFGGKLEYMVGGGALLDIRQQQFYFSIQAPVYQGYGLTEAAPIISSNTPFDHKLGTSGKIMPSITCKIMKDGEEARRGEIGEIVIKGENVMMGYYKNPEATAESIKDGWLWTGDLGYFDEDDFLVVTGRNKALLISEDGEKYSPEGIEEAIVNSSEFIHQAMVYNDHKKFTSAIVTIDPLKKQKLAGKSEAEILGLIKKDIHRFKGQKAYEGQFPSKWTPSSFYIAPQNFSEENKMINSTLKMVRYKITEHYQDKIERIYQGEKEIENENINSIRSLIKN